MVPWAPGTLGSPKNFAPVASTWGWDGHAPRQGPTACGIPWNPRLAQRIFRVGGWKIFEKPQSSASLWKVQRQQLLNVRPIHRWRTVWRVRFHARCSTFFQERSTALGQFCVSVHPNTRWRRSSGKRLRDIKGFFRNIGCALWIPLVLWKIIVLCKANHLEMNHSSAHQQPIGNIIPVPVVFPYQHGLFAARRLQIWSVGTIKLTSSRLMRLG